MSNLFLQLLLYGLAAAAVAPLALVVAALIVAKSSRPVTSVLVFSLGAAVFNGAVALVELVLLAESDLREGSAAGAIIDIAIGAIFLWVGVSAVFSAQTPERDASRRERAERAASGALPAMFLTGIVVQIANIDSVAVMSGGLKELAEANISATNAVIGAAFLIIVMLIPYYGPGVAHLLAPARSVQVLGGMTEWILRNSRMVEIVTGLAIGSFFLLKGLQSLL